MEEYKHRLEGGLPGGVCDRSDVSNSLTELCRDFGNGLQSIDFEKIIAFFDEYPAKVRISTFGLF